MTEDLSLVDYSKVEAGKEFDYPNGGVGGVPIFEGSFLSWGKPEEVIRNAKVAERNGISLLVRIRLFFRFKKDS